MKIAVSNFQSIGSTVLEFTGFAVVTGESNLGKSALVRSIYGLLWGFPGDFYVRRGAASSAVGVKFSDGLAIKWRKVPPGKKSPGLETSVEINGVGHTKIGKEHAKLTEGLGFLRIDTSGGVFTPQIAKQFDKAFLLDTGESVVAEVFKVLGRGDIVVSAKDNARKDLARRKSEQKVRDEDLMKVQRELAQLSWVRPLSKKVSDILAEISEVEENETLLDSVKGLILDAPPDKIPEVPKIPDLSDLISLLEGVSAYEEILVPTVPKVEELGDYLDLLTSIGQYQEILVPKIPEVPPLGELELLDQVRALQEDLSTLDSEEKSVRETLAKAKDAVRNLEKELGICPSCGRAFE